TITFAPGQTMRSFQVPIIDDTIYEGTETVALGLNSPSGAVLGNAAATLEIIDNDPLPTVQFASGTYSVGEGAGNAVIYHASRLQHHYICRRADDAKLPGSDYRR